MTDTASATLLLRRRSSGALLELDRALEIGAGGEARVLEVPGDETLVAKLYRSPTPAHARKLGLMLERPPVLEGGAGVAWPVDALADARGQFAGYLMPLAQGPRIFEIYNPTTRRRTAPLADHALLHQAGASLAAAFAALHERGYVVGDVNESNILLGPDGAVTLVDTDSFQVRDPVDGSVLRSRVGKAEFTPPELQGVSFGAVDRGPEHDRFGLGVLLFLLLMEGTHPFASRLATGAEVPPVEQRIRGGLFPFGGAHPECRPPRLAPPFELLHPELRAAFVRCFVEGHADPASRPHAAEWRAVLETVRADLRACAANPRHSHGSHLSACPWCERTELLGGRDPFPATPEVAEADDRAATRAARRSRPAPAPKPVRARPVSVAPPRRPPAVVWGLVAWRARQPAAVQLALGPTALGSPLPWLAPAVLMVLYGAVVPLRLLAVVVFFLALRTLFKRGAGPVSPATGLAAVGLAGVALAMLTQPAQRAAVADTGELFSVDTTYADTYPATGSGHLDTAASSYSGSTSLPDFTPPAPIAALGQVDREPRLVENALLKNAVKTAYPPTLRPRGIGGEVVLRMLVDSAGGVNPATVSVVAGPSNGLEDAARSVAASMSFMPATRDARPVAAWVEVPVRFNP